MEGGGGPRGPHSECKDEMQPKHNYNFPTLFRMIVSLVRQFRGKETANHILARALPPAFSGKRPRDERQLSDE